MQQTCNESEEVENRTSARGEAQDETRTRDPFLTMEVLYQLSYLGERFDLSGSGPSLERVCRVTDFESSCR
jgi:hypothetical protein